MFEVFQDRIMTRFHTQVDCMNICASIHAHTSGARVRRQEVGRRGENTLRNAEEWKGKERTPWDRGTARQKKDSRQRECMGVGRVMGGAEEESEASGYTSAKGGYGDLGSSPSGGVLVPSFHWCAPCSSVTRLSGLEWKVEVLPAHQSLMG